MGYFFALVSGVFAGATTVIGKIGTIHIPPISYVFFLSLFSVALTIPLCASAERTLIPKIPRAAMLPLIGQILSSYVALWAFWAGIKSLNAAVASFLVRADTLFVLIFSMLFLKESLKKMELLAAATIILGTLFISDPDPRLAVTSLFEGSGRGITLVLISALAFGVTELFSKLIASLITPFSFVLVRSAVLAILFGMTTVILGEFVIPSKVGMLATFLAALCGPVMARVLFMKSLSAIDLSKAMLLGQVEPFSTALLSLILLAEFPKAHEWLGGIIIIAGCTVLFLCRLPKREAKLFYGKLRQP